MWFFFHFFEKHNWSFITEVIWEETRNASPSLECRRRGLWCFCLFFFFHVRLCNDRWRLIIKKIKQRSKYCSCVLTFAFAFFTRITQMRVLTLVGGAYDRDKTCWKKAVFSWGFLAFQNSAVSMLIILKLLLTTPSVYWFCIHCLRPFILINHFFMIRISINLYSTFRQTLSSFALLHIKLLPFQNLSFHQFIWV